MGGLRVRGVAHGLARRAHEVVLQPRNKHLAAGEHLRQQLQRLLTRTPYTQGVARCREHNAQRDVLRYQLGAADTEQLQQRRVELVGECVAEPCTEPKAIYRYGCSLQQGGREQVDNLHHGKG